MALEQAEVKNLIQSIPDYHFVPRDAVAIRSERNRVVDSYRYDYTPEFNTEEQRSFITWHKTHSWIPDKWFAQAAFYNSRVRTYMDQLDGVTGTDMMKSLGQSFSEPPEKITDLEQVLQIRANQEEPIIIRGQMNQVDHHLRRIISTVKSADLTDFALAFMDFSRVNKDFEKRVTEGVPASVDGNAAAQFWTIGPYLYRGLVEVGADRMDAIDTVLLWGSLREPKDAPDAAFPGIKSITRVMDPMSWYLSIEPSGASHQLARKVCRHIARHIKPLIK